jgi:hypothetical protein
MEKVIDKTRLSRLEEVHFVLFDSQALDAYSRVLEELQP